MQALLQGSSPRSQAGGASLKKRELSCVLGSRLSSYWHLPATSLLLATSTSPRPQKRMNNKKNAPWLPEPKRANHTLTTNFRRSQALPLVPHLSHLPQLVGCYSMLKGVKHMLVGYCKTCDDDCKCVCVAEESRNTKHTIENLLCPTVGTTTPETRSVAQWT